MLIGEAGAWHAEPDLEYFVYEIGLMVTEEGEYRPEQHGGECNPGTAGEPSGDQEAETERERRKKKSLCPAERQQDVGEVAGAGDKFERQIEEAGADGEVPAARKISDEKIGQIGVVPRFIRRIRHHVLPRVDQKQQKELAEQDGREREKEPAAAPRLIPEFPGSGRRRKHSAGEQRQQGEPPPFDDVAGTEGAPFGCGEMDIHISGLAIRQQKFAEPVVAGERVA